MHANYMDIRARVAQYPRWFDENGAPRYGVFRPEDSPNIYAGECALVRARCTECGEQFSIEVNGGVFRAWGVLERLLVEGELEVGSPPWHGCRGDARDAVPITVLEFWGRGEGAIWRRLTRLEGVLPKPEAEGEAELVGTTSPILLIRFALAGVD